MNISILREFYLLSQNLSYSATAKRMYTSQSVISKHIQTLENTLGARLLIRDTHSVRLTEAGRIFAEKIADVLEGYDNACRLVADLEDGMNSTLSVGFFPGAGQLYFIESCEEFRKKAPQAKLCLYPLEVESVVDNLKLGQIDVGITLFLMDAIPENMNFRILKREQFGMLASADHPLASRTSISLADLKGVRALVPSPSVYPGIARETSMRLAKEAPEITLVEEMNGVGSIGPLLKANNLVSLTYGCVADAYPEGFVFVPIHDFDISAVTGMLWKSSKQSKNVELFVDVLEGLFKQSNSQLPE